jgi:hypothetical protein
LLLEPRTSWLVADVSEDHALTIIKPEVTADSYWPGYVLISSHLLLAPNGQFPSPGRDIKQLQDIRLVNPDDGGSTAV